MLRPDSLAADLHAQFRGEGDPSYQRLLTDDRSVLCRCLRNPDRQSRRLYDPAANRPRDTYRMAIVRPGELPGPRTGLMGYFPASGKLQVAVDFFLVNQSLQTRHARLDPIQNARGRAFEDQAAGSSAGAI